MPYVPKFDEVFENCRILQQTVQTLIKRREVASDHGLQCLQMQFLGDVNLLSTECLMLSFLLINCFFCIVMPLKTSDMYI